MAGQYEDLGVCPVCPERASTNAGPWRETSEPRSEEYVLELSCMLATAVMCPGWVYVPPNILDPRDQPSVFVGLNWTATKNMHKIKLHVAVRCRLSDGGSRKRWVTSLWPYGLVVTTYEPRFLS